MTIKILDYRINGTLHYHIKKDLVPNNLFPRNIFLKIHVYLLLYRYLDIYRTPNTMVKN